MMSNEEETESSYLLAQNQTQNYTHPDPVSDQSTTALRETDSEHTGPIPSASAPAPVASGSSPANPVTMTTGGWLGGLKAWLRDISLPVYFCIMFFAISSWIDINGLWVEIPLLVNELPESWNLPSYIIVIIQLANVGPLTYTILVKLWPNRIKEWPFVYVIICVGALSCLALVFFWDATSWVGGEEHSTGLLTLTFFLSLVDCTSSVVYLPYMAVFKPHYMTAFYIGEGLSGLIPGLVGLAQGVGGDPECLNTSSTTPNNDTEWVVIPEYPPPHFSVEVFFFFLFCMIIVSGLCFTCIHFMPFAKRERVQPVGLYEITPSNETAPASYSQGQKTEENGEITKCETQTTIAGEHVTPDEGVKDKGEMYKQEVMVVEGRSYPSSTEPLATEEGDYKEEQRKYSCTEFVYLLVITAWINALTNGVLPSTQSYTCLPYGNLVYTLTVRLSTVANPLACLCALFVPLPSLVAVGVLTCLGSLLSAYQLALAALSPEPPMQGQPVGDFLVIITAVLLTALFSYTKVSVASLLRRDGGRTALIWCGGVTQVGSFVGAIITFILVNVMHVFESMPACPVV